MTEKIYKTSYDYSSNELTVENIRTKKSSKHIPEEFIFGNGLFNKATDDYPNYVHGDVWKLIKTVRKNFSRKKVIEKKAAINKVVIYYTKQLKELNLEILAANYSKVTSANDRRRLYLRTFNDKERKIISTWHATIKSWKRNGYPKSFKFRTMKTVEFLNKVVTFFEGIK